MLEKTSNNNGKKASKSIAKLKLEQSIKSLLYNHLVYICAEERDFWQLYDKSDRIYDKTENPLWQSSQLRAIIGSVCHIVTLIRVLQ